jgi:hypothetical protein
MIVLPVHIAAGGIAIIAGAIALYAVKGGPVHRKSGMIFFWSMVVMTCSAVIVGLLRGQRISAAQGVLTFYLVITGMLAVRDRQKDRAGLAWVATILAVLVGLYEYSLGMEALTRPRRSIDGVPAGMIFFFGTLALLSAVADLRFKYASKLPERYRIARHLWRMSFAMWIATASFFLGQAKILPPELRIMPLLVAPVLLVLGVMLYWLVRILGRKRRWA